MNILDGFCNCFFVKMVINKSELNKTLNKNNIMQLIDTIRNLKHSPANLKNNVSILFEKFVCEKFIFHFIFFLYFRNYKKNIFLISLLKKKN
jgi:hypothetical protein